MRKKFVVLAGIAVLWVWTSIVASVVANPNGVVYRNLSPYVWFFQGVPVEATYMPGGGLAVQSVFHATCANGGGDVSFASVDLNYAVIHLAGNGWTVASTSNMTAYNVLVLFTSATTAHCYGGVGGNNSTFEVIQFVSTALKHATNRDLQGNIPPGVGNPVDISTGYTVNVAKSVAFYQGCQLNNSQTTHQVAFNTVMLNATTIRIWKQWSDDGFQCAVSMAEFK